MGVGEGFTWPDHRNARRQYLILRVYEENRTGGAVHFVSSARDFALLGSGRTSYGEAPGFFGSHNIPRMRGSEDLPPGGKNVGGIAFDIPVRRGTYVVLWKEPRTCPVAPGRKSGGRDPGTSRPFRIRHNGRLRIAAVRISPSPIPMCVVLTGRRISGACQIQPESMSSSRVGRLVLRACKADPRSRCRTGPLRR